jgi:hypothetical protein
VSLTKTNEHLLTLDYLNTKLKQAQEDVNLFTLLISEIEQLKADQSKLSTSNNFLKVVHARNEENNE